MANKDDYLNDYRVFFEKFAQTYNPNDQLPVRLATYKLVNIEVVGGIIDWTTQYLTEKNSPLHLIAPITKIVIDEIRKACKKQPLLCGFNPSDNAYEPLKLMQAVMAKINEVCLRYLDNSMLYSLPSPGTTHNIVSVYAIKNTRRRMEDKHVVIHDLNSMFNIQEASPSSYYAIFDGHAGLDAAAYSAAHLHQYLAESKYYNVNPEQALYDAFCKTDKLFLDKCLVENFSSGTTAVCALLQPKEKTLYIAWVGDSQALLVNQGRVLQCVEPHKPDREDERDRIEKEGGVVVHFGIWRVNGILAVSRAIGDSEYKPFVTATPEIREIPLDGGEDFLILACDGLWDHLSEDDAARAVYDLIYDNQDDTDRISQRLVQLAKDNGSSDNISVIVIFLREPHKIAAGPHWAIRIGAYVKMDTSVDSLDNANNPFANSNGTTAESILSQKNDGLLLNLSDSYKQNGDEISPTVDFFKDLEKTNCKRSASDFDDDDDDLGPETDVDAVDDVLMSPSIAVSKLEPEASNNNHQFNPFAEVEKNTLEIDFDILKQQTSEFDVHRSPRDETPTPPVDSVHDAGGLVEAVAESDSEEEDEWNYVRGEQANKENIDPSQSELQVVEPLLEETEDSMSQLNPNAAEFVPISPTHSAPSPVCKMLNDEDRVLSQSPRKPVAEDVDDLSVPNPTEFQNDVKSKPSEIEEPFSNGHQNVENEQLLGDVVSNTNARMELLGSMNKSLASDEFHFGPNAAPFTPVKLLDQSEVSSTKAVYGDDSVATLETSFNDSNISSQDQCDFIISNKTEDPMSMSFYQDKNEESSNPFDLNKVHVLPQDVDEFLNDPNDSFINDTISDLAEHFPLGNPETKDNNEKVQITDLDKDEGKELASPLEENSETEIVTKEDVSVSSCKRFSIEIEMPPPIEPVLMQPISPTIQPTVDICQKIASEDFIHNEISSSVEEVEEYSEITQGVKSRNLSESSSLDICEPRGSNDKNASLVEEEPTKISESSLEVCEPHTSRDTNSPLVEAEPRKTSESLLELCEHHALTDRNSPLEDVTSSVKDEFSLSKEEGASLQGDLLEAETKVFSDEKVNLELETDTSIEGKQTPGACSSPKTDINTTCSFESPKSVDVSPLTNIIDVLTGPLTTSRSIVDIESVTSAEVNSFLERSLLADIVHPLSPDEPELDQLLNVDHSLSRCVYPLDHVIGESGDAPQLDNNEHSYQNENSRPPWSCRYPLQPLPPQYQGMGDNKANDDLSSTISPIPSAPLEEDIDTVHLERGNAVEPTAAIIIEDSEPVTQHSETPQITSIGDTTFTATNLEISKDGTETSEMNESQVETSLAVPLAAVAGIGVVGIAVAHAADKKAAKPKIAPPKKPTPYKLTPSKSPAARTTTASKPSATSPQTNTMSKTAFTSSKPSAPAKTAVAAAKTAATKTSSSPTKTRVSTSLSPKSAERKPLTNGDTKTVPAITKRSVEGIVPRTTATKTNALVPTRPPLKTSASGRTASATASTKPATTANATGAKPRPNTLSAKPATARTTTSTYKPSLTLTKAPTTTKTAPVPKPRPITAPISTKPRVPLSRPTTKTTPDTEKQNKESANKLTAARTSTSTTRSLASSLSKTTTTTSSVRKIESKVTGTRTYTTKTTTTALKTTSKKPIELIKNVSRTKTTKVEKPQQNGITTVITEQMTIINNSKNELNGIPCDPPLINNYPVDNKLIVDTLIDTSSAD